MRSTVLVYSAVGTASLLVLWSGAAEAQQYDWTGPFVGASIGVVLPNGSVPLNCPDGTPALDTLVFDGGVPTFGTNVVLDPIVWPEEANLPGSGHLATLSLGYDLQHGGVVYGAELDASLFRGTSASWTTGDMDEAVNTRIESISVSGGVDQLYSLRSRVGVGIDRLLLFGTAGLAAGHANLDTSAIYNDGGYGLADWEGHTSSWRLGLIVGAGAEYALTDHVSLKLEGLYYDLGSMSVRANGEGTYGVAIDVAPYDATLKLSGTIIRGGINLRF